jgi:8-oxo-dGTP pyrophosphatase MutT (NUDIX family)
MGEAVKMVLRALTRPLQWLSSRANRARIRGSRVEVIACVLCRNPEPAILLGLSPYHGIWMPPQEGVNLSETFNQALQRCLKEECGIDIPIGDKKYSRKIHLRSIRYIGRVLLPRERHGERPIADDVLGTWLESVTLRRKAYWVASLLVANRSDLAHAPDGRELIDIKWFPLADARRLIIETNHADKARLLLRTLDVCERDLKGSTRRLLAETPRGECVT